MDVSLVGPFLIGKAGWEPQNEWVKKRGNFTQFHKRLRQKDDGVEGADNGVPDKEGGPSRLGQWIKRKT